MDTAMKKTIHRHSTAELEEILGFLAAREVPLVYIAHLLCDVVGINFKQVAEAAGIGRGHLYMMLRGIRPVSESARQSFIDFLGLDPWDMLSTGGHKKT